MKLTSNNKALAKGDEKHLEKAFDICRFAKIFEQDHILMIMTLPDHIMAASVVFPSSCLGLDGRMDRSCVLWMDSMQKDEQYYIQHQWRLLHFLDYAAECTFANQKPLSITFKGLQVAQQNETVSCGPIAIKNIKRYLHQREEIEKWLVNSEDLAFDNGPDYDFKDMYLLSKKEVDALEEPRGSKRAR